MDDNNTLTSEEIQTYYDKMKKRKEFDENSEAKKVETEKNDEISKYFMGVQSEGANVMENMYNELRIKKYMAIRYHLKDDDGYTEICNKREEFINSMNKLDTEIKKLSMQKDPATFILGKYTRFIRKDSKKKYEEAQTAIGKKEEEKEKLNYIISSIDNETLSDVYNNFDINESKIKKSYDIYFQNSGGKRKSRRRRKSRKARKSRKSKKARKSRR